MRKKATALVLAAILAAVIVPFGAAVVPAEDEVIESPVLPFPPSVPEENLGLVYLYDAESFSAKVIDFTDTDAETVRIPRQVKDGENTYTVTSIGSAAFSGVTSLTSVAVPTSVKAVEEYAFDGCTGLKDLWFEGEEETFLQIGIARGNEALTEAVLHPNACMSASGPVYAHSYDDHTDLVCNLCEKSRAPEGVMRGDLDEKGGVDIDDAIYLLFHLNFEELYPLNQSGDFDGSGAFDLEDVFYLLYHVNFPDRYPLS